MTEDFSVGDLVVLLDDVNTIYVEDVNSYTRRAFASGEFVGRVSRVTTHKLLVRVFPKGTTPSTDDLTGDLGMFSGWIEQGYVRRYGGPAPRKLGTTPEGMISPDDPRLQWFWDDAGKLADRLGYCSQYDSLTEKLGAPGRMRDFPVTTELGGVTLKTTVKARTQKQADELVAQAIRDATAPSAA